MTPNAAPPLHAALAAVEAAIARGGPEDDAAFDALAVPLFRAVVAEVPAWRRLAEARGLPPEAARGHRDIAPMPTDAFRRLALHAGSAGEPVRVFETSGTTSAEPGRVPFDPRAMALMDLAIDVNARAFLFPDGGVDRVHVVGPSPERAPAKVMLHGMARLAATFAAGRATFHVGASGLDLGAVLGALAEEAAAGRRVLVAGASSTFVHLSDAWARSGMPGIRLASGSRVLHAGGFKGQSRELSPEALRAAVDEALGVPPERCVNLLGMTELSSQMYEDRLAAAAAGRPPRPGLANPPWARTRVLDPETLDEVEDGREGLLAHVDLASATRPFAVLTTDLGVRDGDRFHVTGRATGAALRGCSVGAEAWLDAG